jgi:putative tricarboxylic transport membrane protein
LIVAGIGGTYPVGGLTAMGPGFVPVALGIGLALMGVVILLAGPEAEPGSDATPLRPLAAVTSGILAWVLLAESAGFIPASIAQILLTSLGLPGTRWRSAIVMAVAMGVAGYLVFVVQLGVPLRAFDF